MGETKRRIISEIEKLDGFAWVTEGREVENYLSLKTIKTKFAAASAPPGQFDEFRDYIEKIECGAGKRFERDKILFAEWFVPEITKGDIDVLDLAGQMARAMTTIRRWNGIK